MDYISIQFLCPAELHTETWVALFFCSNSTKMLTIQKILSAIHIMMGVSLSPFNGKPIISMLGKSLLTLCLILMNNGPQLCYAKHKA